jgi:molecular chaperone GrpE (heat shock protein)/DNA-binding Xre family transcriptional regulator
MTLDNSSDQTDRLLELMRSLGFTSIAQFCKATGASEKALRKLRRGQVAQMQLGTIQTIAKALNLSLPELLHRFAGDEIATAGESTAVESTAVESTAVESVAGGSQPNLQPEYDRLQNQLAQQRETLQREFQQTSLQTLEPWLLQWSAAAYAAQQNPELTAVKLLPLMRPVENLLQSWGIEPIGSVGETIAYDPPQHQMMEGTANPGDMVRVRYAGYRQGDRLIDRAKVSAI